MISQTVYELQREGNNFKAYADCTKEADAVVTATAFLVLHTNELLFLFLTLILYVPVNNFSVKSGHFLGNRY